MRRLRQRHKVTAAQVAKDAWAQSNGDRDAFEQLVKEDQRTKSIDPALIILFIRLAMAIFEYFKNRQSVSAESDEEIVLAATRFYE